MWDVTKGKVPHITENVPALLGKQSPSVKWVIFLL